MIAIIAANSLNKVIGKDNKLPWRLSADLKRFKELTKGSSVIMGRKTYESIGGPLTDRHNIILTGNKEFSARNCAVFSSWEDALASAAAYGEATGHKDIFFIGGESVYRQALPLADTIYMTLVLEHFEGDAFFPDVNRAEWEETERLFHDKDDKHAYPFIFLKYERKNRHV
jgi:dihydrofolate reductase